MQLFQKWNNMEVHETLTSFSLLSSPASMFPVKLRVIFQASVSYMVQ